MCLYFSNAFLVGLYSLFVVAMFVIFVGGIIFGEVFFGGFTAC